MASRVFAVLGGHTFTAVKSSRSLMEVFRSLMEVISFSSVTAKLSCLIKATSYEMNIQRYSFPLTWMETLLFSIRISRSIMLFSNSSCEIASSKNLIFEAMTASPHIVEYCG